VAAYSDLDEVFRALADPSRRQLLDSLIARNGQTLRELCSGLDMARQSVSKHLAVLETANLVTTVRRGREKLHYLNAAPINEISERWITRYDQDRVHALADLKRALEENTPVERPSFVYTTYIRTTPERLWQALTDPAFTRRYWGAAFQSDWKVGSEMTWEQFGVTIADPAQVVLESDPYRRLGYTWHSFTPELADGLDLSEEARDRTAAEPRSKVSFEIEPLGELVKLTVVHDGFEPGSLVAEMVSQGWPRVLSGLKTLLETGETLPDNPEPLPPARLGLTTGPGEEVASA
jgi:DNA-binding transcriptional ArsR family regulator